MGSDSAARAPDAPADRPRYLAAEIRERAPRTPWQRIGYDWRARGTKWALGRVVVISSLVEADLPDGSGVGPQWHVSVSATGKRPTDRHVAGALKAFGMVGAEEDNHHPGVARHFWRPVDPKARVDCECKETEQVIVEPSGYRWSNPLPESGEACRGCWLAGSTGAACPLHPRENAS